MAFDQYVKYDYTCIEKRLDFLRGSRAYLLSDRRTLPFFLAQCLLEKYTDKILFYTCYQMFTKDASTFSKF